MKAPGYLIITIIITVIGLVCSCAHRGPSVEPVISPATQPIPELSNDACTRGYVEDLLVDKGLDRERVHSLINDPRMIFDSDFIERNIDFARPKGPSKHPEFLEYNKKYVIKGKAFIRDNRDIFKMIKEKYEVSPEIITAILILETRIGTYPQKYYAFRVYANIALLSDPDVLALLREARGPGEPLLDDKEGIKKTLARGKWAAEELYNLILLADEIKADPLEMRGSFGGALGPAQFIPSTFRKWGVDGDGNGEKNPFDLFDAMASTANLLKKSGWRENGTEKNNRTAIWLYNHSDVYVNTIMKLYRELLQP
ncbi:MAG TPA: lytic murein transglycosylase [Desulfomonilia bacterium]|nr:lytic murein transglycosylase [Desulfomonilia bacterium]